MSMIYSCYTHCAPLERGDWTYCPSIDISLLWSENCTINMSPRWGLEEDDSALLYTCRPSRGFDFIKRDTSIGQLSAMPWQNLTESNTFDKSWGSLLNGLGDPTPTDLTSRLLVLSSSRLYPAAGAMQSGESLLGRLTRRETG